MAVGERPGRGGNESARAPRTKCHDWVVSVTGWTPDEGSLSGVQTATFSVLSHGMVRDGVGYLTLLTRALILGLHWFSHG